MEGSRIKLTVEEINEDLGPVCTVEEPFKKIDTIKYIRTSTKIDGPPTSLLINSPSPITFTDNPLVFQLPGNFCTPKRQLRSDNSSVVNQLTTERY